MNSNQPLIEKPKRVECYRKLDSQEQMDIAKLVACFWKPLEIVTYIFDKYGKKISRANIENYVKGEKWKPIIEKFREDYNKALYDVPLFSKRKRLDELQKHYEHHMDKGEWRKAQSIIRDVRDEVEQKFGDFSLNFTQITQYNELTDEQIQEEKVKTLDMLERMNKMKKLLEVKNAGSSGTETEVTS